MKKITICIVTALLCLYARSHAQESTQLPALTVGDTLPALLEFKNVVNYPSSTIALSELSDKLILLDFWASWCTPCIKAVPHIDTLKQSLGKDFTAILVSSYRNPESIETVEKFSLRYERLHGKPNPLPVVLADSTVSFLFRIPHLPHYVWIWNRQVIAITKKPLSVHAARELLKSNY